MLSPAPIEHHSGQQGPPPAGQQIPQIVTFSNSMEATLVDFNPDYPGRPKVQCLRSPSGERFENPSRE